MTNKIFILFFFLFPSMAFADQISSVCFTPGQDCQAVIVGEINKAERTIYVQAYAFTSAPIAEALLNAHKRGVGVWAVLDKSNVSSKYSVTDFLKNHSIPVWIDGKEAIAHNKVIVIDSMTVITGSFNFTRAAQEKNAENILFIKDARISELYILNIEAHKSHSYKY